MGSKITQLETTNSPSGADLLVLAKDPSGSPLSRAVSITNFESALANRVTEGANVGTGFEVFREKTATSLAFRTIVGGKNITISSAASLITIANAASADAVTFTLGASNTWNNELIPVWQGPRAGSYTLVELNATTSGTNTPTLNFNLQRRDFGAMASAGVDIFAASQAAVFTGLSQTSFATSVIGPKNHLMFTTGSGAEGGSVNYITMTLYYTK